jgi:hypothetical protein
MINNPATWLKVATCATAKHQRDAKPRDLRRFAVIIIGVFRVRTTNNSYHQNSKLIYHGVSLPAYDLSVDELRVALTYVMYCHQLGRLCSTD